MLDAALRSFAARINAADNKQGPLAVTVFNPHGWERSDLARTGRVYPLPENTKDLVVKDRRGPPRRPHGVFAGDPDVPPGRSRLRAKRLSYNLPAFTVERGSQAGVMWAAPAFAPARARILRRKGARRPRNRYSRRDPCIGLRSV
ncbi:MAG: hypothetical protein JW809_12720 [Pirellulales bacterium]|nr:hypothetical protein [Pirellulales bacterium]